MKNVTFDSGNLTDHVKSLVEATANISDAKVAQARKKVSQLIDEACDGSEYVDEKFEDTTKAVGNFIQEKPFQAVGIGILVGAALVYLLERRK